MERIKVAVERAKAARTGATSLVLPAPDRKTGEIPEALRQPGEVEVVGRVTTQAAQVVPVDRRRLKDFRIFSFDGTDRRSAHFDMLRTRVLQLMDAEGWKKVAISSPTPGCGKSVTALNLTMSIARLSERSVMLVDLDLRKPQIAKYLGIANLKGLTKSLESNCRLEEALVAPAVGNNNLTVLADDQPVDNPAELIASDSMKQLIMRLSECDPQRILVFDLPPVLSSDDFLAFLPQVDCVLIIAAVGESTIDQVAKCERLIGKANLLGVALNKASASDADHSAYY